MTDTRILCCLICAVFLLPDPADAQAPVQVRSARTISGAPPLFQSQPDREIAGRFINFTDSGCALSFSASSVRGLTWSGACSGGRMQGRGTVIGYDYEQQPLFIFEGHIERGLRTNGEMHEVERKNGHLIGWRTAIVGSVLQPHSEVPFLDMPQPFLLALNDWNRQTDGKDLLASMGATWAPVGRREASGDQSASSLIGTILGAAGQYQQAKIDREQALSAEQQRQLQAQEQEQQRRRLNAAAAAARPDAANRPEYGIIPNPARNQAPPVVPEQNRMGPPILNSIGSDQQGRSSSGPPAMPHIEMTCPGGHIKGFSCGGVEGGNDRERLAREQRNRDRDYREQLKRNEEESRRKKAILAEQQRQHDDEVKRQQQAQNQVRANERANLEAKVRAAIFASGAIVSYIDKASCQGVFI